MSTPLRTALKTAGRSCLALALATMTLVAPIAPNATEQAHAALATIKTIDSDNYLNTANRLKLTKDNCTVVSKDSNIKLKDINGMTAILAKIKSTTSAFNYSNPYELLFENAAAIGGRQVNVRLKCTKVTVQKPYGSNPFSSRDDPSYDNEYLMIGAIRPATFTVNDYIGQFKDYTYRAMKSNALDITVTYADNGKVVDLPFMTAAVDIDASASDDAAKESWTAVSGYTGDFYEYRECELLNKTTGDGEQFYPPDGGLGDISVDAATELKYAGVIATTSNGKFSNVYAGPVCAASIYLYSQYANIEIPTKTVSAPAGTAEGKAFQTGDEVKFEVVQKMGTLYEDMLAPYKSFEVNDTLDEGVTYQQATMFDGEGTDVTKSAGTLTYNASSRTVNYTFKSSWLNNTDNYNGQSMKLVITTTANKPQSTTYEAPNYARTTIDQITNKTNVVNAVIARPVLALSKTVENSTLQAGDSCEYRVEVTQTNELCDAQNVVVSDEVPAKLKLDTTSVAVANAKGASIDGAKVTCEGNEWRVSIPSLAYGTTAVVTFTCTALENLKTTTIDNAAQATADYADPVEDTATVEIVEPKLSIVKSVEESLYSTGDTAQYKVVVTQTNDKTEGRNVEISDTLPTGLELAGTPELSGVKGSVSTQGNTWTVEVPTLKYGKEAVVEFDATVHAQANGTKIVNRAQAVCTRADEVSDEAAITVYRPQLAIEKSADKDLYTAGETVHWSIELTQTTENATARNICVTDTLPSGMTNAKVTDITGAPGAKSSIEGEQVTISVPELAYGKTVRISLDGDTTQAMTGKSITNHVSATAPDAGEDEDDKTVSVARPVLALEKSADKEMYQIGDDVTYTLKVTQTAEQAVACNTVIEDEVPEYLELDASSITVNGKKAASSAVTLDAKNSNKFTLAYGALPYGETAVITFKAAVTERAYNANVTNTAFARADYANEVSDEVDVYIDKPQLSLVKSCSHTHAQVGTVVDYTLKLSQLNENCVAKNVVLTDTLPAGLELTDDKPVVTAADKEGNPLKLNSSTAISYEEGSTFTMRTDELDADTVLTIAYQAKVTEAGADMSLMNTAKAVADYADEVTSNAIVYGDKPELKIVKTASSSTVQAGDTFTYTLKVTQGNEFAVAHDVVVEDMLPDGVTLVDSVKVKGVEGAVVEEDESMVRVEIAELSHETPVTIMFKALVDESVGGEYIENTGTVTAYDADEQTDTATINVPEDEDDDIPEQADTDDDDDDDEAATSGKSSGSKTNGSEASCGRYDKTGASLMLYAGLAALFIAIAGGSCAYAIYIRKQK